MSVVSEGSIYYGCHARADAELLRSRVAVRVSSDVCRRTFCPTATRVLNGLVSSAPGRSSTGTSGVVNGSNALERGRQDWSASADTWAHLAPGGKRYSATGCESCARPVRHRVRAVVAGHSTARASSLVATRSYSEWVRRRGKLSWTRTPAWMTHGQSCWRFGRALDVHGVPFPPQLYL